MGGDDTYDCNSKIRKFKRKENYMPRIKTLAWKRVLSLLLVFVMCLGLIPNFVINANASDYDYKAVDFTNTPVGGFPVFNNFSIEPATGDKYTFVPNISGFTGTQVIGSGVRQYIEITSGNYAYAYAFDENTWNSNNGIIYKNVGVYYETNNDEVTVHDVDLRITIKEAKRHSYNVIPTLYLYEDFLGAFLSYVEYATFQCTYVESGTSTPIPDMTSYLGLNDLDNREYMWCSDVPEDGKIYVNGTDSGGNYLNFGTGDELQFGYIPNSSSYFAAKSIGKDSSRTWDAVAGNCAPEYMIFWPINSSSFTFGYGSNNYNGYIESHFATPPVNLDSGEDKINVDGQIHSIEYAKTNGVEYEIAKYVPLTTANPEDFTLTDNYSATPLTFTDGNAKIYEEQADGSEVDITGNFTITNNASSKKITAKVNSNADRLKGKVITMKIKFNFDESLAAPYAKTYIGHANEVFTYYEFTNGPADQSTLLFPTVPVTVHKEVVGGSAPVSGWQYNAYIYYPDWKNGSGAGHDADQQGFITADSKGEAMEGQRLYLNMGYQWRRGKQHYDPILRDLCGASHDCAEENRLCLHRMVHRRCLFRSHFGGYHRNG